MKKIVVKEKAAEYGAHIWFDADGVIFDCRHKVSSSVCWHAPCAQN